MGKDDHECISQGMGQVMSAGSHATRRADDNFQQQEVFIGGTGRLFQTGDIYLMAGWDGE